MIQWLFPNHHATLKSDIKKTKKNTKAWFDLNKPVFFFSFFFAFVQFFSLFLLVLLQIFVDYLFVLTRGIEKEKIMFKTLKFVDRFFGFIQHILRFDHKFSIFLFLSSRRIHSPQKLDVKLKDMKNWIRKKIQLAY